MAGVDASINEDTRKSAAVVFFLGFPDPFSGWILFSAHGQYSGTYILVWQ